MKTKFPSVERNGIVSGLLTGVALTAYFLIMQVLGYAHILELRFFNFVILAVGVCWAISKYKKDLHNREFYLQGWAQGIYTSAVAVLSFAIFMSIYMSAINPELLAYIQNNVASGQNLSGFTIFLSIFMEGMAGGFVITLSAMQYFKTQGAAKRKISPIDTITPKNKSLNV
jgi:hypothetical protein